MFEVLGENPKSHEPQALNPQPGFGLRVWGLDEFSRWVFRGVEKRYLEESGGPEGVAYGSGSTWRFRVLLTPIFAVPM